MQMAGSVTDSVPTILDLNEDCWRAVLDYVPVLDIIRTERTSRWWQEVVLTYLRSKRISVKDAKCPDITIDHRRGRLLTLKLAHLPSFERWTKKLGTSVVSACCSQNRFWNVIRKNCPNLEDLMFFGFGDGIDENGSPKCLRRICFFNCHSIPVDHYISKLRCNDKIELLEIFNCYQLTGQCMINTQWPNLKSLTLNDSKVSPNFLAATCLGQLTSFELRNAGYAIIYEKLHVLLDKMPKLQKLCVDGKGNNREFYEAVSRLRHLKDLKANFAVTDEDLDTVTQQCLELKTLRLGRCGGVTARGVAALCGNAGARLLRLDLHWSLRLKEDDVVAIVSSCRNLEILQLDGCYALRAPALLARAAAARRGRTPLHLAADFDGLHEQEYKELVYHDKWSGITCAKCA